MSYHFKLPDHAMRYARDAEAVDRKQDAMLALRWFLTQKQLNREWTKSHERLILRYFDLCIELRTPLDAKEGLYRYRILTQINSPSSLHKVVMYLVDSALQKAREARAEVKDSTALDKIEDLEGDESPENLLMSTMSTETTADRLEREVLIPWVRHAWDTFRNVLDQLRNVIKLEETYHDVSCKAFDFCKEFNRTTEFRKLCMQMRLHLRSWRTYQDTHQESGWSQETMERHISAKFVQLRHCADMEMWSEGHRTVEDIHLMMQMTGLHPAPHLMAQYYDSLARIFWVSGNYLFHAYALFKHFVLVSNNPKLLKSEDKIQLAAATVLASLCIPLYQQNASDDETYFKIDLERDKKKRLAQLLNFSATPSRAALMEDLRSRNLTKFVPADMQTLWDDLEARFQPLQLVERVQPVLTWASKDKALQQYVVSIERLLVHRLVEQLSRVYNVIRLSTFEKMVNGLSLTQHEIEQVILRAVRSRQLSVRLDHQTGVMRLGDIAMESEILRRQLSQLSQGLRTVCDCINAQGGDHPQGALSAGLTARREAVFREARESLPELQRAAIERKELIERRKEGAERVREIQIREEEARRAREEEQRRSLEEARLREEQKRREEEKLKQLQEEAALKEKEQLLRAAGKEVSKFSREQLKAVDSLQLREELNEKRRKEQEDEARRREDRTKRIDYLVRALRETEQAKLDDWTKTHLDEDEQYAIKQREEILNRAETKFNQRLNIKHRLARVAPYVKDFESRIMDRRQAEIAERRDAILLDAKKKWARQKVARAAQRKREEELVEREREVEAARERQNAEREERAMQEAQLREREIERKTQEELQFRQAQKTSQPYRPPAAPESTWRAREPPAPERSSGFGGGRRDGPRADNASSWR